ncbi:MAG TPA: glycosyltransferase family A protein [Gemmatimonadaceae bacterium]|nr:glycosyltransferase family A protein [Gemmatimonadaceae bacterium]
MPSADIEGSPSPVSPHDRLARGSAEPKLSVIFAPRKRPESLRRSIFGLHRACSAAGAELVVVNPGLHAGLGSLPRVRMVPAPAGADVRQLRDVGARYATGDVLLFVEDDQADALEARLVALRTRTADTERVPSLDTPPASAPVLSVIVPVHQGAATLQETLLALAGSGLGRARWELIVVCDACSDESAAIAAREADLVVRLPGGRAYGPAYARNRGAELASAEHLVFVDGDVKVHPAALERFHEALVRDASLSAVVGIYDTTPTAPGFVSQYRNLLNHWVQRRQDPAGAAFWSGCGAVRQRAFRDAGRYDEWRFSRPQVEDAELGQRLRQRGHRIELRPDITGKHLKRWTLFGSMAADVTGVGAPWARLEGGRGYSLRMGVPSEPGLQRVNAALSWAALLALLVGAIWSVPALLVAGLLCLVALVVATAGELAFLAQERGVLFALAAVPLEVAFYLASGAAGVMGWMARVLLGDPRPHPAAEAFAEVGVRTWPPVPAKPR